MRYQINNRNISVHAAIMLLFFVSISNNIAAKEVKLNKTYLEYIDKYSEIAVEEQTRSKIPASIKLAQALLESGAGRSELASKSKNHFGIKCHSSWKGKRTYHDDDTSDECFRVYNKVDDSYKDHSEFLKAPRYASLFDLKITDYKGWAYGLKKCGYATNPKYPTLLIKLIEDYELYNYDKGGRKKDSENDYKNLDSYKFYRLGDLLYIVAKSGDSYEKIAEDIDISARKLRSYNETPKHYPLIAGDIVYLQKKNKKADNPFISHTVGKNESMHSISQRYGIRMSSLYKLNKKKKNYTPQVGEILKLR